MFRCGFVRPSYRARFLSPPNTCQSLRDKHQTECTAILSSLVLYSTEDDPKRLNFTVFKLIHLFVSSEINDCYEMLLLTGDYGGTWFGNCKRQVVGWRRSGYYRLLTVTIGLATTS
ncbi:hypothetical protein PoB_002382000 [Plakobranchus ocellatus]|uniref:Uncharacterized protein n=1 Tax=Plakobranchus ocellatus TaxID=259542 RepID=A0AAV3ZRU3_9GAST|nr:hypothetical protein PoB_002382000 [Plakobranchus ocellatus]